MNRNSFFRFATVLVLLFALSTGIFASGGDGEEGTAVEEEIDRSFSVLWRTVYDNRDIATRITEWEEMYGVTVEKVLVEGNNRAYREKAIALHAAGDTPDVIVGVAVPQYAITGLLGPLDPYIDLKHPKYHQPLMDGLSWRGKHYFAGNSIDNTAIIYNKSMFENNGLKTPDELFDAGEWTWENFKKAAIELTQDSDGDGKLDIWGFTEVRGTFLPYMILSNGGSLVNIDMDGNITHNLNDPRALVAADFVYDAVHVSRYMNPEIGASNREPFCNGQIAMLSEAGTLGCLTDMRDEWGVVLFPAGPSMPAGTVPPLARGGGLSLLAGAKNPAGGAAFIDFYYQWYYDHKEELEAARLEFGSEMEPFMKLWELPQGVKPDLDLPGVGSEIRAMYDAIREGGRPGAVFQERIPALEAAIREIGSGS